MIAAAVLPLIALIFVVRMLFFGGPSGPSRTTTNTNSRRGAVRTHMFAREPQGPEALYLHDADALDWLGAIGVARIIGIVDPKGGMRNYVQLKLDSLGDAK